MKTYVINLDDTEETLQFDQEWDEIECTYLEEMELFVVPNASFDRNCLNPTAEDYTSICLNSVENVLIT